MRLSLGVLAYLIAGAGVLVMVMGLRADWVIRLGWIGVWLIFYAASYRNFATGSQQRRQPAMKASAIKGLD